MNSQNDEGCGNLEMGKYAPVWMSGARENDESDILNELSPNPKIHQNQYVKQERDQMLPKVSSIKDNIVTTILQPIYQKPVQVKTVKDNV